jgi:hypothetical protein
MSASDTRPEMTIREEDGCAVICATVLVVRTG